MSPHRLAWRTLLLGRPRSVLAVVLISACLCVLDLFAGNMTSVRARVEMQAVIGERLGHLVITPGGKDKGKAFDMATAARIAALVSDAGGVALVAPQVEVAGVAANGRASSLFAGVGSIASPDLPGRLDATRRNGIAISSNHARTLGVKTGSNVNLTAVAGDSTGTAVRAEVADIFATGEFNEAAHTVVMPLALAQSLIDSQRVDKLAVYLSEPEQIEPRAVALLDVLRKNALSAEVHSWLEMSPTAARERRAADITFDAVAGMVFAVIAAAIAATVSMNALERRREVATLRALGMHASGVFVMFIVEALWMAVFGVVISLVSSSLIAWVVNRASLSYAAQHAMKQTSMLVELDFNRMLMGGVTLLAVTLLAALVPAFKAARAGIAEGLAGQAFGGA